MKKKKIEQQCNKGKRRIQKKLFCTEIMAGANTGGGATLFVQLYSNLFNSLLTHPFG